MAEQLSLCRDVDIDQDAVYKYILEQVRTRDKAHNKAVGRGYQWAPFHGVQDSRLMAPLISSYVGGKCGAQFNFTTVFKIYLFLYQ